jgi:hypothetical protein
VTIGKWGKIKLRIDPEKETLRKVLKRALSRKAVEGGLVEMGALSLKGVFFHSFIM